MHNNGENDYVVVYNTCWPWGSTICLLFVETIRLIKCFGNDLVYL